MKAIYKREVTSHLRGLIGWVAIAVMLFVTGIYFTAYNLQQGYPYFGYVLRSISFLLLFLCPALTMRTFAEERRQRTDQLLLTAPVSITGIVVGKYLALLTIFAIPTAVCGVYPLVLSQFGTVPILETYATLLAFFLLGAACLAVGMFFSSITENQVIAFVATVVTLLVSYLMDGLKTFVTSGSTAGLVLFTALAIAAGALAWYFTKSWLLGGGVFVLLELVLAGVTLLRNSAISSAFDAVLSAVTLFSRSPPSVLPGGSTGKSGGWTPRCAYPAMWPAAALWMSGDAVGCTGPIIPAQRAAGAG